MPSSVSAAVLVSLLVAVGGPVLGQDIDLGGRAFGDYFYAASAPEVSDTLLRFTLDLSF